MDSGSAETEPAELARQLARRCLARLNALDEKVLAVPVAEDDELASALRSVRVMARALLREIKLGSGWLDGDVEPPGEPFLGAESSVRKLQKHLRIVDEKVRLVDSLFFQTNDFDVPKWLRHLVAVEGKNMGLEQCPVIVPTQASNFDTGKSTLEEELEAGVPPEHLDVARKDLVGGSEASRNVRHIVLRVPRLEGRHAHWIPLSIGHEMAHHYRYLEERAAEIVGEVIAEEDLQSVALPKDRSVHRDDDPRLPIADRAMAILALWLVEHLCDVYSLVRYGPASISALASYLHTLDHLVDPPGTHPRGAVRLRLMLETLGEVSPSVSAGVEPLMLPWEQSVNRSNLNLDHWFNPLESWVADRSKLFIDAYHAFAMELGGDFAGGRETTDVLTHWRDIASSFREGSPAVFCGVSQETHSVADLLNGAWIQTQSKARTKKPYIEDLLAESLEGVIMVESFR